MTANGIPADSLTAVGFGEDSPIVDNMTRLRTRHKNRRIEFITN